MSNWLYRWWASHYIQVFRFKSIKTLESARMTPLLTGRKALQRVFRPPQQFSLIQATAALGRWPLTCPQYDLLSERSTCHDSCLPGAFSAHDAELIPADVPVAGSEIIHGKTPSLTLLLIIMWKIAGKHLVAVQIINLRIIACKSDAASNGSLNPF